MTLSATRICATWWLLSLLVPLTAAARAVAAVGDDAAAVRKAAVESEKAADGGELAALRRWITVADDRTLVQWAWANHRRAARARVFTQIGRRFGKQGKAAERQEAAKYRRGTYGRPTFEQLARGVVFIDGDEATMHVRASIDVPEVRKFKRVEGQWRQVVAIRFGNADADPDGFARKADADAERYRELALKVLDGKVRTLEDARRELRAIEGSPTGGAPVIARPLGHPNDPAGESEPLIGIGPAGWGFASGGAVGEGDEGEAQDSEVTFEKFQKLWPRFLFEKDAAARLADPAKLAPTAAQAPRLAAARAAMKKELGEFAARHKEALPKAVANQTLSLFQMGTAGGDVGEVDRALRKLVPYAPLYREKYAILRRGRLAALEILTPAQGARLKGSMIAFHVTRLLPGVSPNAAQRAKLAALYAAAATRLPDDAPSAKEVSDLGHIVAQLIYEEFLTHAQRAQMERASTGG